MADKPRIIYFSAAFTPAKDKIEIVPKAKYRFKNSVNLQTIHISCKSDIYLGRYYNYGGVIIYQYDDMSEWRTANNTRCKTGYIVIQNTDSENVEQWMGKEPGAVHGAVYRNAFGESVNEAEVVGEGFAIRNGKFEMFSSVFNNPKSSAFHDRRRRMNELSEHCVRKVVEYWKTAGPCRVRERNFEIKHLLELDFDFDSLL
jgi:hypothetical protein